MATIKSYTDLKQSKVLSKILSDESADMYWWYNGQKYYVETIEHNDFQKRDIHCWSLAALLSVLPKHIGSSVLRMNMSENDFNLWFEDLSGTVDEILPDITKYNPIDACYEMILKLNKLKML